MQVKMSCGGCYRHYNATLEIPIRLECSVCGNTKLMPSQSLLFIDRNTGKEIGMVEAGVPFSAAEKRIPKTVILRVAEKRQVVKDEAIGAAKEEMEKEVREDPLKDFPKQVEQASIKKRRTS